MKTYSWRHSSLVKCLPNMGEVLSLISSTASKRKRKENTNFCSRFIHSHPKLEAIQISFNGNCINKLVHLPKGVVQQ
jgi:hypothetical protein